MIMMPPRELMKYIATDENGKWIHAENMPKELEALFEEFVKQSEEADSYRKSFSE